MNQRLIPLITYRYKMTRFVFFCLIFLPLSLFSQEWSKVTKKADQVYETHEYFKAYNMYKDAQKKVESKAEKTYIAFQMAQCLRFMNQTIKAEAAYLKAITRGYNDPIVFYYYAEMLKKNTKYTEAAQNFEEYSKRVPDDNRGADAAKACRMAAEWLASPTRYVIENRKEFNSKESEFAANFASPEFDVIYFTSTRTGIHGDKINPVTGENYTDIFETQLEKKGTWSKATALNDTVNSPNDDGTPAFGGDNYNNLFFTRCKIVRGVKLGCQIYLARRQAGDDWLNVDYIPISQDSISIAHPTLSKDGLTLYFVSDMPGGFGGNDIYMTTRKSKTSNKWEPPVNMGMDINSPGNEVFPFIRENGILYFASDYHPGMGGLDIFMAMGKKSNWTAPDNMRYPVNSPKDDFLPYFTEPGVMGYLSSNRDGGSGADDIYTFSKQLMLVVRTFEKKEDGKLVPLKGVNIELENIVNDVATTEVSDDKGELSKMLICGTSLNVTGYLQGYIGESKSINSVCNTGSDYIYVDLVLDKIELNKTFVLENIYYDFDKWNIRPDAAYELDKLVTILNEHPEIDIELSSHTDSRGTNNYNERLSQRRAESAVEYIISRGINDSRITARGYGENKMRVNCPDGVNCSESDHQLNRRTEFTITKIRK